MCTFKITAVYNVQHTPNPSHTVEMQVLPILRHRRTALNFRQCRWTHTGVFFSWDDNRCIGIFLKPMVELVGPVVGKQNGDKCDISTRLSRADSLIDDIVCNCKHGNLFQSVKLPPLLHNVRRDRSLRSSSLFSKITGWSWFCHCLCTRMYDSFVDQCRYVGTSHERWLTRYYWQKLCYDLYLFCLKVRDLKKFCSTHNANTSTSHSVLYIYEKLDFAIFQGFKTSRCVLSLN